jgi:hypothetical protein
LERSDAATKNWHISATKLALLVAGLRAQARSNADGCAAKKTLPEEV